jgi:hypothetical protein
MRNLHALGIVALVAAAGCSSSGGNSTKTGIVSDIKSVQTSTGIFGSLHSGSPTPTSGGPSLSAPINVQFVNGGTATVPVSSSVDFIHLAVAVDGDDGYYDVTFPADPTAADLLITLAQDVKASSLSLSISAAGSDGQYGQPSHVQATITKVGSGDVQISLSWSTASDLDLHVVGPDSVEIYYGNPTSPSGGTLDLDSNAGCSSGTGNENVTWPTGQAPSGTYTVRVDDYAACGAASTNYVVTISVAGKTPVVYQGTFTGDGDGGGAGAGRLITTFTK